MVADGRNVRGDRIFRYRCSEPVELAKPAEFMFTGANPQYVLGAVRHRGAQFSWDHAIPMPVRTLLKPLNARAATALSAALNQGA